LLRDVNTFVIYQENEARNDGKSGSRLNFGITNREIRIVRRIIIGNIFQVSLPKRGWDHEKGRKGDYSLDSLRNERTPRISDTDSWGAPGRI